MQDRLHKSRRLVRQHEAISPLQAMGISAVALRFEVDLVTYGHSSQKHRDYKNHHRDHRS